MLPVYFLSILFNGLAGLVFVIGKEEAESGGLSLSLNNETVRFGIGILTFVTGILKILSPVAGNIPVAGDLLPALTGIAGGLILVSEFYRNRITSSSALDYMEKITALLLFNRKIVGFICIGVAVIHLIFYPIILL